MKRKFVDTDSKIYVEEQKSKNNKDNIQKERKEGFTITDTETHSKSIIIQSVVLI